MPRKGTKLRSIRVDDELWLAAQAQAAAQGRSVSEVIREFLRRYVSR